jgi:diguanylate cyclase (GGDEF)-like protein
MSPAAAATHPALQEREAPANRMPGGIWIAVAALSALAAVLLVTGPDSVPAAVQLRLPWWVLIPAFAFALTFRVNFEFRDQSRSTYLDQLCLLAGLFFCTPAGLVGARVLGGAIGGAPQRQPIGKLAMNIAAFAAAAAVDARVFHLLWGGGRVGVSSWPAGFVAAWADQLVTFTAVLLAMTITARRWQWAPFAGTVAFETGTGLVITCLALVGVTAMAYEPASGLVLAFGVAAGLIGFRGYNRMLARQRALERLYNFARQLGPVVPNPADLGPTLAELRRLLHADRLELALLDEEQEATVFSVGPSGGGLEITARHRDDLPAAAVAVLGSSRGSLLQRPRPRPWNASAVTGDDHMFARMGAPDHPFGLLTAAHRSGPVRRFDRSDLHLLEVVAGQLGTALERGRLLENLRRAATRDSLTGLANLDSLRAHLARAVSEPGGEGGVVVLFMDLDRFQDVNDTLGHDAGDALLVEVAQRLEQAVPTGGLAARVGGDKFAMVLPGSAGSEVARLAALAIKSRIEGPVRLGELSAEIRITIGMARAPQHAHDGVTLLRRAEMAMSAAKGTSGGITEWQPDQERDGTRRLRVLAGLRQALAGTGVRVVYQPKLVLGTGEVAGVEALVRWDHPELGPISPLEFVPLAEASGLIGALTTHVLRTALTCCHEWHHGGVRMGVAVNLSPRSLVDPVIVGQVAALLTATEVDPRWLTLEITEGSVMENPTTSIEILHQLRELGVRLAIDDFGTGYSSLTYVRGLPVDEVKIDKAFITNLADDRADQAVVRAIVELAHSLDLITVAEGVETADQALTLEALGVDEVQGFFYARPMGSDQLDAWLAPRRGVPPG